MSDETKGKPPEVAGDRRRLPDMTAASERACDALRNLAAGLRDGAVKVQVPDVPACRICALPVSAPPGSLYCTSQHGQCTIHGSWRCDCKCLVADMMAAKLDPANMSCMPDEDAATLRRQRDEAERLLLAMVKALDWRRGEEPTPIEVHDAARECLIARGLLGKDGAE